MSARFGFLSIFDYSKWDYMANIKYFIKGKKDIQTINLRFYNGRKFDLKKSTGLFIKPEYWNNTKGQVKQIAKFENKTNLKNELAKLRAFIIEKYNNDFGDGVSIDSRWLSKQIDLFNDQFNENEIITFIDFANHFIKNLPNKVLNNGKTGVSKSTSGRYETTKRKIIEYENSRRTTLKLEHIDRKFYFDFKKFLHEEKNLNLNTTGGYIKNIKSICLEAKLQGFKISPDIDLNFFKKTTQKVDFITLNEIEINRIFKHDFSKIEELENIRDWLIIGVWTGARASDLLKFNSENVNNGFIEYTAQKTGQTIVLPIHNQVETLLKKRKGNFPKSISAQRFNKRVKKVCEIVGINKEVEGSKMIDISESKKAKLYRKQNGNFQKWELVTSHICRRSFATNHYGKLPTPVLMTVTGHKTETMFLKYIGKSAKDNAEVLKTYWNNQIQKRERKPKMKIFKNAN